MTANAQGRKGDRLSNGAFYRPGTKNALADRVERQAENTHRRNVCVLCTYSSHP